MWSSEFRGGSESSEFDTFVSTSFNHCCEFLSSLDYITIFYISCFVLQQFATGERLPLTTCGLELMKEDKIVMHVVKTKYLPRFTT